MVIFTPFFGYIIIESFSQKKARGCKLCGNKYIESEYCGLCGKSGEGVLRDGFIYKHL